MPGKRCGENEDQPKVERPWGRPPGSKTRLSSGSGGRRCGLGRGGAEAVGILLPGQTHIKRRRRVMCLEDEMTILEKLEEGFAHP